MGTAKKATVKKAGHGRGHTFGIWVNDDSVLKILNFLTVKWYQEGKIPEANKSKALAYMVHNFGEATKRPPENGSLHLDPVRRQKITRLAETFKVTGVVASGNDAEVVNATIDLLYGIFSDETVLNDYVKSKLGLP